uniref:DUF3456 domain-containing protein n=1 Tax=Neolamprologus brichardi TaxID=32507 RepID=A0A3Q4FXS2_NEOBR
MSDYALYVDPSTQHKQYRRFAPRSSASTDDFPDFKNFQFDGPEASNDLKFATRKSDSCSNAIIEIPFISLFILVN